MGELKILPGYITAEITSADTANLLNTLVLSGITIGNVRYCDALTVIVSVNRHQHEQLVLLAEKCGAVVKKTETFGVFLKIGRLWKRPILLMFFTIVFLLGCYVPSRIFFISVDGNSQVPQKYILQVAEECGINFGAKRRLVRSEMMKNRLLEKIPQLQWAGINTSGCTAIISVREKTTSDEQMKSKYQVSSIVASRDGIIQSCTVQQGNALCAVGQAVKAGQVLVSGYLDCGIVTKTTQADAEINALTFRDVEVISPNAVVVKEAKQRTTTNYALRIGKKLIKFYKDSGNLDTSCGKIYLEEYIHLPGGFRLPIAVVKEIDVGYVEVKDELPAPDTGQWIKDFAYDHLKKTMISGEIISADVDVKPYAGVLLLQGRYACKEMIGQIKYEESIPKDDGQ